MNSSSEAVMPELTPLAMPELRTGEWTRYGNRAVLGDATTEQTLSELAESTRVAAGSQGYSVGWAEGQRAAKEAARLRAEAVEEVRVEAEARRAAEHATAVEALRTAAAALETAVAEACARIEDQASTLAFELTATLVGHEVAGVDVVRRVLALAPSEPVVRVRLHPDDAAAAQALTATGAVVVADVSLRPGDALVETDDHVLDLRLDTALARVRAVLVDGVER